jgi:hypothetical protein
VIAAGCAVAVAGLSDPLGFALAGVYLRLVSRRRKGWPVRVADIWPKNLPEHSHRTAVSRAGALAENTKYI